MTRLLFANLALAQLIQAQVRGDPVQQVWSCNRSGIDPGCDTPAGTFPGTHPGHLPAIAAYLTPTEAQLLVVGTHQFLKRSRVASLRRTNELRLSHGSPFLAHRPSG